VSALLDEMRALNATAAFNVWAGFEVTAAERGTAELRLPWRQEFGQYAGYLHAGLTTALIDTACGFAVMTLGHGGSVLASHCAVDFLGPGRGTAFVARGRVVQSGRRQVFTFAELFAERDGDLTLIASGQTLLVPIPPPPSPGAA